MAKKAKVEMHLDHVMLRVKGASEKGLHALALQVEGVTKVNIVANDQVDTGFMMNSVYVESSQGSTFGETWGDGSYSRKKSGGMSDSRIAPKIRLPRRFSLTAVVVGAIYAIFQEMQNPFLRPAGEEVMNRAKGICEPVFRRAVRD